MKAPFLIENANMGAETQTPWWRKITSLVLIVALILHMADPRIAIAAPECLKTGSVCAEGAGTRNINGYPIYKDCWRYEDTYQCTSVGGVKACDPISKTQGCGQTYINCLETGIDGQCIRFTKNYTCNIDYKALIGGVLPEGVTELPPTHKINSEWDETECNAKKDSFSSCKLQENVCTQGISEKVINGVKVSFPCWEETRSFTCLSKQEISTCDAAELNDKCTLKSTSCINEVDGVCQTGENVFQCLVKEGTTEESNACKDKDFGKVMAGIEGAREFARYFDENSMTFFKGDPAKCTVKLGGAIGGDCCKPSGEPNKWTDAAITAGVQYAVGQALASTYTYTILLSEASTAVGSIAAGASAVGLGTTVAPSVSTMGVGVGATTSGNLTLMINPTMLVAAIVIMVVMAWLECDPEEKKTALRNKAGICHFVGSYCQSKVLGVCVTKAQSYCCYVSKLARIINEQGREQINKPWTSGADPAGQAYSVERPNCTGFNQEELEKLDFSKLNLDEFVADLVHITPDNNALTNSTSSTVSNMLNSTTSSSKSGNYYDQ